MRRAPPPGNKTSSPARPVRRSGATHSPSRWHTLSPPPPPSEVLSSPSRTPPSPFAPSPTASSPSPSSLCRPQVTPSSSSPHPPTRPTSHRPRLSPSTPCIPSFHGFRHNSAPLPRQTPAPHSLISP
ncbi:hypothetical protein BDZ91DRAFT_721185 [Kalaharituber pfeilii]|nr:hypothetical protein BDZ91DRAFT_721185 [Kalaharituber pfeilii]